MHLGLENWRRVAGILLIDNGSWQGNHDAIINAKTGHLSDELEGLN